MQQNSGSSSLMSGNVKLYGLLLGVTFLLSIVFSGLSHLGGSNQQQLTLSETVLSESSVANTLSKIQLAARLMPSQNTEGNKVMMDYSNENEKSGAEEYFDPEQADSIAPDFFKMDNWENYFATVRLTDDYVPVGSGKPLCLHLEWIKKAQSLQIDRYLEVQDFPTCASALNTKVRWQASDPKTGLTFKPWKQTSVKASQESDCADLPGSTFVRFSESAPGRCYSYEVVDRLCITVKYEEHPDTASYSWNYAGGCFANGLFARYTAATTGQTYSFDKLPIEVRQVPGDIAQRMTNSTGVDSHTFLSILSKICFLAAIVFLVLLVHEMYKQFSEGKKQKFAPQVDEE